MMKKYIISFFILTLLFPWTVIFAQGEEETQKEDETKYTIELQEQIGNVDKVEGDTGFKLFVNYVSLLYKYGASIIGLICVLVIVVSGVQISMGGVNQENVSNARNRIFQALLSMLLLFMSAAILHAINPNFFQ